MFSAIALSSLVYLERGIGATSFGSGESGSGFVVASTPSESYIVTAAHVLGCTQFGDGCVPEIVVRFADSPQRAYTGKLVYAGLAATAQDIAVVSVARGALPLVPIARDAGSQITLIGFPESAVRAANTPRALHTRTLPGKLARPLLDGRRLLALHSEPGDSGAPIVDNRGAAVGVLQGREDSRFDVAVGAGEVQSVKGLIERAIRKGAHVRADALYQYALSLDALRNGRIIADGQSALNRAIDRAFGMAISAGSVDAAVTFANEYDVRRILYPQISTQVASAAGVLLATAAQHGNEEANFTLYTLYRDAGNTQHANAYLQAAYAAGYPFAIDAVADTVTDAGAMRALRRRAYNAYEPYVRAAVADAAWNAAMDYQDLAPPIGDPGYAAWEHHLVDLDLAGARMGSRPALQTALADNFMLETPVEKRELFEIESRLALAGDEPLAQDVGHAYEVGAGVKRDPLRALDYYAVEYAAPYWNGKMLQQKIDSLVPDGAALSSALSASPAYLRARDAVVGLHIFGADAQTAEGVIVAADAASYTVATASSALSCDAYLEHCAIPQYVQLDPIGGPYEAFGNGTIGLLRVEGTSIEDGIALLTVPRSISGPWKYRTLPVIAPVPVATRLPQRIFSVPWFKEEPFWGIVRSTQAQGRVLTYDIPVQGFDLGHPLFDVQSGALVGIVTDPNDVFHATAYPAIAAALHTP